MAVRKKWILIFAAVASLSLVAAACGGEDETTASPEGATSAAADTTDMTEMTITDIVAGDENFSTLLAAVGAADLGGTLAGEGPFTVFAPTDDAFAALPEGTLDTLLEPENKDQLASILTYHVLSGEVLAADVQSGEVTTVNGAPFTISVEDGGVFITDGAGNTAEVITTDITTSNGVIHVIDSVLLPE
ncbi:MAG TPA: fasciclin domain-containing protein [Actinomycetota bacterium]|nr:fasciclin domain-containing protein [Actinomycetota bacterium]